MLQAMADSGKAVVRKRATPYVIDGTVRIPAGCRFEFEDGVVIIASMPATARAAFSIVGDDVFFGAPRGTFTVRRLDANPHFYAVFSLGPSRIEVRNLSSIDCGQCYLGAKVGAYEQAVTSGPTANVCRDIVVSGGGSTFAKLPPPDSPGACIIAFCVGFRVEDCRYVRVGHGVQWWGGDANPGTDAKPGGERKCRQGIIRRVSVSQSSGTSVWGSMGDTITVSDCTGENAGDVGFDAEGSIAVTFQRCTQRNAKNACFASFFDNEDLRFVDCVGEQASSEGVLFRTFNAASGSAHSVVIDGGSFRCTGTAPGTIDDAYGPIAQITVRNATLSNVLIRLHFHPHQVVTIENNALTFPAGTSLLDAILVGPTRGFDGQEHSPIVRGNRITSAQMRGPGSAAVRMAADQGQRPPTADIKANIVSGFPIALGVGAP
jgi:3-dehydroquinate dehydratase